MEFYPAGVMAWHGPHLRVFVISTRSLVALVQRKVVVEHRRYVHVEPDRQQNADMQHISAHVRLSTASYSPSCGKIDHS